MSLNASYFRVLLLQAIVFYAASIGRLRAELSVTLATTTAWLFQD